jgi:Uma2 family endonuclease
MNAAAAEVLTAEPKKAAPVASTAPMTLEAWANMEEDEPGEFVDGQLVEEEVQSYLHEAVVSWLIGVLRGWGLPRGCPVFGSEAKLRVSRTHGRKPDVSMYAPGTRLRDAAISRKPPMLVVEVISRSPRDVKRDRHEKRHEYAQFGVQHYWLIDPDARVIEFLALGPNGHWDDAQSASDGRVEVAGFEGLVLDLDHLWAEVDAIIGDDEDEVIEGDEG